ncbi:hypothetical protein IJT10_09210 [bacterium]|nr:hypothetical protein [bacterium]
MHFVRKKFVDLGNFDEIKTSLLGSISGKFSPVISGGYGKFLELLGQKDGSIPALGDVFVSADNEMFYYNFVPGGNELIVGGAWNGGENNSSWESILNIIKEVAPQASMEESPIVSPYFELLREDSEKLKMGEWERKASMCLRSPETRKLLHTIAMSPSISLPEASQGRSILEVGRDVEIMDEMGIICREFEVFCSQTGQKISRVSSLSALDDAAKRGFRCFHCGKPISQEQVVQSLSVSPNGMDLANPCMWLVYSVGIALLDCGISIDNILFRHEPNFEICEVFADYKGDLLMFSIFENGLDASSVFKILTRARYFHPDYIFAVTSEKVAEEAYQVVNDEKDRVTIINDITSITDSIREVIGRADRNIVVDLLKDSNNLTHIDIDKIVCDYFLNDKSHSCPLCVEKDDSVVPAVLKSEDIEAEVAEEKADNFEQILQSEHAEEIVDKPIEEPVEESAENSDVVAVSVEEELPPYILDLSEKDREVIGKLRDKLAEMDTDTMEYLLESLASENKLSGAIVDGDGMPLLGGIVTMNGGDDAVAIEPELVRSISEICEGNNLGCLGRIFIAFEEGSLDIYASADGMSLMIHNSEVGSLQYGGKDGEGDLHKALTDLTAVDGLVNAIVVNEDVIIDATTNECDSVALAVGNMCNSVAAYLTDVGNHVYKCVLVGTDEQTLVAYPLIDGSVLVCVFVQNVRSESWEREVPKRVNMVEAALI